MPDDVRRIQSSVVARHGKLAQAVTDGEQVADGMPGEFADGCFGAAGYDDTSGPATTTTCAADSSAAAMPACSS